jgi:hypothetical protein
MRPTDSASTADPWRITVESDSIPLNQSERRWPSSSDVGPPDGHYLNLGGTPRKPPDTLLTVAGPKSAGRRRHADQVRADLPEPGRRFGVVGALAGGPGFAVGEVPPGDAFHVR